MSCMSMPVATSRRGSGIPVWLLFVYFGLFGWAFYYIVTYWGGVGPGRVG